MTSAKRIILTREEKQNKPWAQKLREQGHDVLELPMVRFELLPCEPEVMAPGFHWILFTSIQAVHAFVAMGLKPGQAEIGALGDGTARVLTEYGLPDTLHVRGKDGAEMAENFTSRISPPGNILLPGAEQRVSAAQTTLNGAGFSVTVLSLYRTLPMEIGSLENNRVSENDLVFFCSPSAVKNFSAICTTRVSCVAIGETTATACRVAGLEPLVAQAPTFEAMVQAAGLDSSYPPGKPEIE